MEWQQNISKRIFKLKYMLSNEESELEVFKKIADEISSVEKEKVRNEVKEDFFNAMVNGRFIPAGRILANARPESKLKNYNNCFVIDIEDSMDSITDAVKNYMTILKQGGGVGFNISKLRPKDTPLSTGGESSGPLPFLEIFDQASKTIEVGGQRRGASICIMDVSHPDIEEFVTYKQGDKNKKLTQFNISVGITDRFIDAVKNNEDWELRFNGRIYKTLKARKLYSLITKNAYLHNEPGILNLDTVNRNSNAHYLYTIKSTNPCVTRDTLIAVADGRNAVPIKDLINTSFPVYSARPCRSSNKRNSWIPEIKSAFAFETGEKDIIEVFLSDDSSFTCTKDHLLALSDGGYIKAEDSLNKSLGKFFSYSEKIYGGNTGHRHINSKTNGYVKQHRLIWEYYNGVYDGKTYNIHHINKNKNDDRVENLQLITKKDHDNIEHSLKGKNNPVFKIKDDPYFNLEQKRKNIIANSTRWKWSKEKKESVLQEFYNSTNYFTVKKEFENTRCIEQVDYTEEIYVKEIKETGLTEKVYDLHVEDNHNFYIITKTDDEKFLNCSGVLIHNCGEITLPPNGVCCLGAINLTQFVVKPFQKDFSFDWDLFYKTVKTGVRFLDNVLDVTEYPLPEIKERALSERRIGLGITGLGSMFAMMRMEYGSEESQSFAHLLFSNLRDYSYASSVELAKEKGSFPSFKKDILESTFIKNLPIWLQEIIREHGLRNISLNTIAPTGTTSLTLGQNCSSGIEPIFALEYERNVRTKDDKKIKERVYDYSWLQYLSYLNDNHYEFTDTPAYFKTALEIDPYKQIDIQAIAQTYIDNSISKCIEENTILNTSEGQIKIKNLLPDIDLKEGTFYDLDRKIYIKNDKGENVLVKKLYYDGKKEGVLIKFSNGYELVTSINHKLKTLNGWKKSSELKIGDKISYIYSDFKKDIDYTPISEISNKIDGDRKSCKKLPKHPQYYNEDNADQINIDLTNESFVEVKDIKQVRGVNLYDIEVEGNHTYLINGIVSHNTANIPETYSKKDYENLFMYAYEKGVKGFTSFRLGSMQGVLETIGSNTEERPQAIDRIHAPKRPENLYCDIHEITVNKERHIVLVGLMYGTIYEIFVTNDPKHEIDRIGKKQGIIKKVKQGQYSLIIENGVDKIVIENIADEFNQVYSSLSRMISMALRHGTPLQFVVDQLNKDKNFVGFEKSVARVLKKYIKEGEKVLTDKCGECGGDLIFQEGCVVCPSCGFGKCG